MDTIFLFSMSVNDGSVLAVVADATCDVGLIGYEMALLVSRTEATLTPQLVSEMRSRLPVEGPVRAWRPGDVMADETSRLGAVAEDEADVDETSAVRPYAVTGGRTRPTQRSDPAVRGARAVTARARTRA